LIELTNFSCSVTENSRDSHLRISQLRVQVLTQSWLNLLIEMGPWSTKTHLNTRHKHWWDSSYRWVFLFWTSFYFFIFLSLYHYGLL